MGEKRKREDEAEDKRGNASEESQSAGLVENAGTIGAMPAAAPLARKSKTPSPLRLPHRASRATRRGAHGAHAAGLVASDRVDIMSVDWSAIAGESSKRHLGGRRPRMPSVDPARRSSAAPSATLRTRARALERRPGGVGAALDRRARAEGTSAHMRSSFRLPDRWPEWRGANVSHTDAGPTPDMSETAEACVSGAAPRRSPRGRKDGPPSPRRRRRQKHLASESISQRTRTRTRAAVSPPRGPEPANPPSRARGGRLGTLPLASAA